MLTTPQAITPQIENFCNRIIDGGTPVRVNVGQTVAGSFNNCYPAVDRIVAENGGSRVDGWMIWELAGMFLQSEHHAVWNNGNELIDITEKQHGETSIIFLPDPTHYDTERLVMNHMEPLSDDLYVRRYVEATMEHTRWKVENMTPHVEMTAPRSQMILLRKIEMIEQYWGMSAEEREAGERDYPLWYQMLLQQYEEQLDAAGIR